MNKNNGGRAAGKNPAPEASDKSVKVKYISSPVLVEAKNPSQFKEIVQHFTGHNASETSYSMYSNPTTMAAATTTSGSANANTTQGAGQYFAYGTTHMNPQAGIDGYSWEEIAEWNRNR